MQHAGMEGLSFLTWLVMEGDAVHPSPPVPALQHLPRAWENEVS